MNTESLPLNLYKANVELQLRITRLLQESGHGWLEVAQQFSAEGMRDTTARVEHLLNSANWQALVTLPSDGLWRVLQGRLSDAQTIKQTAIKSQAAFTTGFQQARASWQRDVSDALGAGANGTSFAGIFERWGAPSVPAATAARGKTGT